jgi:hypothetical protein
MNHDSRPDPAVHQNAISFQAALIAARSALQEAEQATRALTDQASLDAFPAYETARYEAAEARAALTQAPALLPVPHRTPFGSETPITEVLAVRAVVALIDDLAHHLTEVAQHATDTRDKQACLNAAHHVRRMRDILA